MTDFEKQQFERQKQLALDSFYETYNPKKLRGQTDVNKPEKMARGGIFSEIIGGILGESLPGDTALVAALLTVLIKEGADLKIILALLYIIM